jgi:hypothetical protein
MQYVHTSLGHARRHVLRYAAFLLILTGSAYAAPQMASAGGASAASASAAPCAPGHVQAFARVKGRAGVPAFYTSSSAVIDTVYNCTGGSVIVRRSEKGVYYVRFTGLGARLALTTANSDGRGLRAGDHDNAVSVAKVTTGVFRVEIMDIDETPSPEDGQFTIMAF